MDKNSDKKNLEQQKKRDKRYDKCKYCYWMWSDSFCIKRNLASQIKNVLEDYLNKMEDDNYDD